MWIAVFKTGRHTDSKGNEKTWTEGDLDNMVAQYDPKSHEAPVVIGHPKDNAPAYGWVEGLKRAGDTLWAEIRPTVAEFTDWLKAGLFKKRSISLYPDMTLKHIGFLGAMPPAVKGLPDFAFNGPDAAVIEFEEGEGFRPFLSSEKIDSGRNDFTEADKAAQESRARKHGISAKEGGNVTKPSKYADVPDDEFGDPVNYRYPLDEEHIHAALAYWTKPKDREQYSKEEVAKITARILAAAKKHGVDMDKDKFKFSETQMDYRLRGNDNRKGGSMNFWDELKGFLKGKGLEVDSDPSSKNPGAFSEADVKAAVTAAVEKAKADIDASFAEKEAALKAKEVLLVTQAADARKREIAEFCESLKQKGILTPAMEKLGMGITSFMQAVAGIGETYEFAEAAEDGKKAKQSPLEFMQAFLSGLPRAIEFKEVAKDEDDPGGGDMDAKRERAIKKHMADNGMGYKEAMLAVSKKHPELFGREAKK